MTPHSDLITGFSHFCCPGLNWFCRSVLLSFCRLSCLKQFRHLSISRVHMSRQSEVNTIPRYEPREKGDRSNGYYLPLITSTRFRFDMRFWFHTNYNPGHSGSVADTFTLLMYIVAQKHLSRFWKLLIPLRHFSFSWFHS